MGSGGTDGADQVSTEYFERIEQQIENLAAQVNGKYVHPVNTYGPLIIIIMANSLCPQLLSHSRWPSRWLPRLVKPALILGQCFSNTKTGKVF